ncbi:tripartite tricarboxylate transporter substrate-binding protein [Polaromonas sp.]|uniref:Bug family tripartite tricarboxylate transporter substrate binding protein n=1 Tax=Polaromonas sp. TaxID=1869339 RepID=UPI00286D1D6F|nr:tripartite tricarboxylate transporter substrate-binding protein [Polaromonas sp.]
MNNRRLLLNSSAILALGALGLQAHAAAWPSQPLRIVVPFAPGGTSDVIARLISKPLSDALGVPVLVENRTGAAGNIGAAFVANATDNHTVLLSDLGSLAISPLVTKDLPFQPGDLQGVAMLAYSPHLFVVHPSVAASNLKELVALSQTTKLNVASAGSGTPNHLGVVQIALETGMKWQHVPYRGGAQALNDTAAGTTQIILNGMLATMPLVQGGRLKVIGISKGSRMPLVANIPTIAEQGLKNFESGTYQGVTASSKMPRQAIERLNAEMVRIVRSPELRARLLEGGAEVMTSSPGETTDFITRDRQRWAAVIKRAGTQLEGTN